MTPSITLTTLNRTSFLVSPEDEELVLSLGPWSAWRSGNKHVYVRTTHNRPERSLHRILLNAPPDLHVDHLDGDGLNNTRANLRLATKSQNQANRRKSPGTLSRHKGVTWHKLGRKWHASIYIKAIRYHLGVFTDEDEAGRAYDLAARDAYGEFARLNFPDER